MARKMRDSGVEWIGEVPEGWEFLQLKRLAKFKGGVGFPPEMQGRKGESIRFIKVNSLASHIDPNREYDTISQSDADSLQAKVFPKGTIVFAKVGAALLLHRFERLPFDSCIDNNMMGIFDVVANPDWLCYALSLLDFNSLVNPGAVPSVNQSQVGSMRIPTPPLPEQRRIADYLDEKCAAIDGAVDELKRGIEDCKAWKKAIIFEAVTGKANVLAASACAKATADKKNAKVAKRQMRDSGIPWIGEIPEGWEVMKGKYLFSARSGDAIRNEILADNGTYPVYGGGEVIGFADNWNCDANTVLIGRVGARCGCVTLLRNQAWATDNALIISTNKCVRYITYLLIGANLNQFNSSNAQPLITAGKIKNLPFPFVCDLREQQAIADYLDEKCAAIDALVAEKEELIADLEAYKKSLIFELVTGKREVA